MTMQSDERIRSAYQGETLHEKVQRKLLEWDEWQRGNRFDLNPYPMAERDQDLRSLVSIHHS